ncbi:Protein of unknown function [Anaerovirgula multivorans]|uniref:DUF551 domain-containing protein n=1 Tax=Anaerovirgula multivorans TaxID=312168 RepID=A0A238ZSP7_9FIRM|nr:DUF551 domain-containing protein [Anaerovirgula multivorans]SNR85784.1 Protein of unknown function [Anaerovirgula multivorans]
MSENNWISVSDKLPEVNQHVLLFLENNEGEKAQVVGYIFFSKDKKFEKCNNEFSVYNGESLPDFLRKECVLAWQLLPKPYKLK